MNTMELPGADADLTEVLGAWHHATLKLQQTHEILQGEVRRLTEELEIKNRELARKNRLADLGQMASHIAHEVRNGLVPITLYISLLKRKLSENPPCFEILEKLQSAFCDLDTTVNDLLHFTSDREANKIELELDGLIEEVCCSILPQFESQNIQVFTDVPEGLKFCADRDMLRRGVLNLLFNAIDAMQEGGKLVVKGERNDPENAGISITISDTGCGFGEEALKRAAEPFFSTKSTGTGLGLAIVCRVVEVHHGSFQIGNRPEGGAMIRLNFPG